MEVSQRLSLFIFSAITAIGAYWTFYFISSMHDYCFHTSPARLYQPYDCSSIFSNFFTVWGWWIIVAVLGAVGLVHVFMTQKLASRAIRRILTVAAIVIIFLGASFTVISLTQQMCTGQIRFQNGTVVGGCGHFIDYEGLAIGILLLVVGLLVLLYRTAMISTTRNAKSLVS